MVKQMNDIKKDIDGLFNEFEKTNLYNDYLNAKKKLEKNEEIMEVIKRIKELQKIATKNKNERLEKQIKDLYSKLNGYPLYQSYLILKDEIEEKLFFLKEQFDKYFSDILFIESEKKNQKNSFLLYIKI